MKTNAAITTRTSHNGNLAAVRRAVLRSGGTVRSQTYDGLLRLKDLNIKDPGQSTVMSYQHSYDLTNNLVSKLITTATAPQTLSYTYDTLDRLTAANDSTGTQPNEAYSYDPVANRLSQGATGSTQATLSYAYNANNQLLNVSNGATGTPQTLSYTYDANGNTISQSDSGGSTSSPQARNYVYDTNDRLVEVRDGSSALIAVYSYDPFGRRLSKDTGTKKIYYLYNEEGLIAEADASGQLTKSYGYAPQSSFTTNPLWMKSGNGSTGSAQAYYTYQNDHLGTPQKLLTQSGQTVWSATYDSYGNATIDPAYTIVNNLRNPGQYYDTETGLHYNWMRYYDPRAVGGGRYLTSDPIGLRGGINLYTYVGGNPVKWKDAYGLYVEGFYDQCSGHLFLHDTDSNEMISGEFESGGKPWGAPAAAGTYAILNHNDPDFFRLDPLDARPYDDINSSSGQKFIRLHKPGNTTGCVAATDKENWAQIRDFIRNTKTKRIVTGKSQVTIPRTSIIYKEVPDNFTEYGQIFVISCGMK